MWRFAQLESYLQIEESKKRVKDFDFFVLQILSSQLSLFFRSKVLSGRWPLKDTIRNEFAIRFSLAFEWWLGLAKHLTLSKQVYITMKTMRSVILVSNEFERYWQHCQIAMHNVLAPITNMKTPIRVIYSIQAIKNHSGALKRPCLLDRMVSHFP